MSLKIALHFQEDPELFSFGDWEIPKMRTLQSLLGLCLLENGTSLLSPSAPLRARRGGALAAVSKFFRFREHDMHYTVASPATCVEEETVQSRSFAA